MQEGEYCHFYITYNDRTLYFEQRKFYMCKFNIEALAKTYFGIEDLFNTKLVEKSVNFGEKLSTSRNAKQFLPMMSEESIMEFSFHSVHHQDGLIVIRDCINSQKLIQKDFIQVPRKQWDEISEYLQRVQQHFEKKELDSELNIPTKTDDNNIFLNVPSRYANIHQFFSQNISFEDLDKVIADYEKLQIEKKVMGNNEFSRADIHVNNITDEKTEKNSDNAAQRSNLINSVDTLTTFSSAKQSFISSKEDAPFAEDSSYRETDSTIGENEKPYTALEINVVEKDFQVKLELENIGINPVPSNTILQYYHKNSGRIEIALGSFEIAPKEKRTLKCINRTSTDTAKFQVNNYLAELRTINLINDKGTIILTGESENSTKLILQEPVISPLSMQNIERHGRNWRNLPENQKTLSAHSNYDDVISTTITDTNTNHSKAKTLDWEEYDLLSDSENEYI